MTTQPAQPGNNGKTGGGCAGCLSIVAVLFVVGLLISMCGGGSSDDSGDAWGAKDACHGWVEDQLKAPSTADFHDDDVSGDGPWTITGSVDAENSFGAKIRTSWTCDIRLDGDTYRGNATLLE